MAKNTGAAIDRARAALADTEAKITTFRAIARLTLTPKTRAKP
jgi:hypothetical protein